MLMMDKRRKPHHIALDNEAFYAKCENTVNTREATQTFKLSLIKRTYTNIIKGD